LEAGEVQPFKVQQQQPPPPPTVGSLVLGAAREHELERACPDDTPSDHVVRQQQVRGVL
jgi:hypothetical protein